MAKQAGRPKVSQIQKAMRHVGKHFYIASQFMDAFLSGDTGVDTSKRRGKRQFDNKTKSLQESVKQYQSYYTYMVEVAQAENIAIDVAFQLNPTDKEMAWAGLAKHIREDLDKAQTEKIKAEVFASNKRDYIKTFPYAEWHEFWIQAELNCQARTCRTIAKSLKANDLMILSMTEVLRTEESLKGQSVYQNQNGKKSKSEAQVLHAKIIRYQNRANQLKAKASMSDDEWANSTFYGDKRQVVRENDHPRFALIKLETKIQAMEDELKSVLDKSPEIEQVKFNRALAQKVRRSLLLKGDLSKDEKIALTSATRKVATLDQQIKSLTLESEIINVSAKEKMHYRINIANKDLRALEGLSNPTDIDESNILAVKEVISSLEVKLNDTNADLSVAV